MCYRLKLNIHHFSEKINHSEIHLKKLFIFLLSSSYPVTKPGIRIQSIQNNKKKKNKKSWTAISELNFISDIKNIPKCHRKCIPIEILVNSVHICWHFSNQRQFDSYVFFSLSRELIFNGVVFFFPMFEMNDVKIHIKCIAMYRPKLCEPSYQWYVDSIPHFLS